MTDIGREADIYLDYREGGNWAGCGLSAFKRENALSCPSVKIMALDIQAQANIVCTGKWRIDVGTLYGNGVSSGDIGAAIAEGVIQDVRINGLGI